MHQIPVFEDPTVKSCLQSSRILISLKQVPRAWYEKLHGSLNSLGFIDFQFDHSLLVRYRSLKAEYRSLVHIAAEITWICKLLVNIGYSIPCPPQLS